MERLNNSHVNIIPPEYIERIEIIQTAASIQYGSDATSVLQFPATTLITKPDE